MNRNTNNTKRFVNNFVLLSKLKVTLLLITDFFNFEMRCYFEMLQINSVLSFIKNYYQDRNYNN